MQLELWNFFPTIIISTERLGKLRFLMCGLQMKNQQIFNTPLWCRIQELIDFVKDFISTYE